MKRHLVPAEDELQITSDTIIGLGHVIQIGPVGKPIGLLILRPKAHEAEMVVLARGKFTPAVAMEQVQGRKKIG